MNPLNYWFRLLRLFYHYQKRSTKLPYLPVRLWVELSSFCNFKCIMCPNKDLKKEYKGNMDFNLFKKIIDEVKDDSFEINLAHRGESLLHPQIIEAIHYSKKRNLYTRLHTNGSLLTESLSTKIIQAGLDRLSFSFDGYDKKTYENIRIGGNFNKTVNNIIQLLKTKKELRSKKPEVAIEVINFKQLKGKKHREEKEKFFNYFRNLPLDSFVHKELHNWAGEFKKKEEFNNFSICTFPWNALVIYWDGSVLPCTQDFFGYNIVGNVKNSSIKEIWNNKKMVYLRKKLALREIKEFKACSNCDRLERKNFLGVPKEYLWKFIIKKMP